MNYASKFEATLFSDGQGEAPRSYLHIDPIPSHAPADAIVVADAHFLFNAEFKRSGLDLILAKDERELVLRDYFKSENRAALASPDGACLTGDLVRALSGAIDVSQAGAPAASGEVIGHVTKLVGSASAMRNGVSIVLNQGDNVEKGDVVEAGSNSTLGITFIDGTVFGLSSNARMVLNEMVYDPNGSNNSSLLSLIAGTITFVAGETAKHGDMKVDTPVATMGIRGTAVLVQIDFTVPGQSTAPDAKFQVLVEPDGNTGSYILFDKSTLQPLAVVSQAGQQINISNGVISQTSAPLSPEIQKLITDVFSLKFSALNTKTTTAQTDTINPLLTEPTIKLASGTAAVPQFVLSETSLSSALQFSSLPAFFPLNHLAIPPTVAVTGSSLQVRSGTALDTATGTITFADVNTSDRPTAKVTFGSFALQDAHHNNITSSLTAQQLAAIAALEPQLILSPSAGNTNFGSITWTYSAADSAFSVLPSGDTLTLTYVVEVDTNFPPLNIAVFEPLTLTITASSQVVWIHPTGGLWRVGSNWSIGQAPTANDDVIIPAQQIQGGTGFYPVTIATPAFAHTVTLDAAQTTGAQIINQSSFTVSEAVTLLDDAVLTNEAKASFGRLELFDQSSLQNSGLIALTHGGDFEDRSIVVNRERGAIELAGGTLNVLVDIANSGLIQVDAGSQLHLTNAIISGGTLSINSTFITAGGSVLDGVMVANANIFQSMGGTLTIDSASTILNTGALEAKGGNLVVDTGFSGNAEVAGASMLQLGANLAGAYSSATVTFDPAASGTLKFDHAATFKATSAAPDAAGLTVVGLDDNKLDFSDVPFGSHTTVSYSGDTAGGILSIFVGGLRVSDIRLTGDYLGAHFIRSDDGSAQHGTAVAEAAGAISGLVNGNAVGDQTLTVSLSDGGRLVSHASYDWQVSSDDGRTWLEANGVNGLATYTPVEADEGRLLRVLLSFTDSKGNLETSTVSAGTVQESPAENAAIVLAGLSDGNAVQGQTLTASVTDKDAPTWPGAVFTYSWIVGGQVVQGDTGNTYTPTEADEGKAISVAVSFTDGHGLPEHGSMSAGIVQEIDDLAVSFNRPAAQSGAPIQVTQVTDGGAIVSSGASYAWQVSSDGGQSWTTVGTNLSFTPGEAQEGNLLQLVVTYADASGSESATFSFGMLDDLVVTLDRTTAQQDLPIRVTDVTDGNSAVFSGVTYAWQTSSDGGQHWTTVGTNADYTPVAGEDGNLLQLVVTYVDPGEREIVTESLGVVAPAEAWNGGSGTWESAGQWSSSAVPTSSDNAVVDTGGEAYTLKIEQAGAAHSVVLNSTVATVEIVEGGTLTLGGNLAIDAGSFLVDPGATLKDIATSATIAGSLTANGTVEASGGRLQIASTSVAGTGSFKIDAGATLQLDHASSHNVLFSGAGELILEDPAHFSGTISDGSGRMSSSDLLDLAGFDAGATVQYIGDASGGAIKLSEASHATAFIKVGANSTHWSAPVSDGHGGILIHDPPADDSATGPSGSGNDMPRGPFHDLVAGKLNPVADSILRGPDGFVFKPGLSSQTASDCDHGPNLPEPNNPGAAGVIDLVAVPGDAHGEPSIPPGSPDATIQDSVKAHLLAYHANFHFI